MNVEGNTQALLIRTRNEPMQPVKPGFATEDLNQWLTLNAKVNKQVSELWEGDIQRVLKDTTLSPEGKQKKLATLGAEAVKGFVWMGRVRSDTGSVRTRLEKLLSDPITAQPKGNENEVVLFLSDQEIRGDIPRDEANAAYLRALESGNVDIARALRLAPGGSWVDKDIQRRGDDEYARRTNPEAWQKLQDLLYLQEHLESLAAQTGQWLMSLGATAEAVQKTLKP